MTNNAYIILYSYKAAFKMHKNKIKTINKYA